MEGAGDRIVAEQPRGGEIGPGGLRRRQTLQGLGDPRQDGFQLVRHGDDT
jgi:hypothetical protein